jgi:hypothetical protein
MHDPLRAPRRRRGTGTTVDRFRLNEVVSQIAFGGRMETSGRLPLLHYAVAVRISVPGKTSSPRKPPNAVTRASHNPAIHVSGQAAHAAPPPVPGGAHHPAVAAAHHRSGAAV